MRQLMISAIVAYAVVLSAPRNNSDFAALALRASLFFAQVSVLLAAPDQWHDASSDEPNDPAQDA